MFNWKQHRVLILITVGLGLVVSGCKDDQQPGSDHRIAATANAANAGEIQVGQLALTMAVSDEVKGFATRMVNEHLATQQRQTALFARLGIIPEDDATSLQLQAETKGMLDSLRMRSGPAFDLAYIDGQITMHTRVLELLNTLIPAVQKDALRADLSTMRSDVSTHKQAARSLRTILGGGTPDGGAADGGIRDGGPKDGAASDGGPDGGRADGGRADGGSGDGGSGDGGVRDGGTRDGGTKDGGMVRLVQRASR